MKKFLFILVFSILLSGSIFATEVDLLLKVPGMSWPGTAYRVSSTLKGINGVKIVNTSLRKKEVYVKYDDSITNVKKMLKALEKSGYKAEVLNK